VMLYVRFPLSLRNVEDLLHERGIDVSHETVRFWWNRFGPMFAAEIRRKRSERMRSVSRWRWHLDEVFVKVNGKRHYLWRAVDHEGEVLESFVTKRRDKRAALKFLKKAMRRHGGPEEIVTDRLPSYRAAMRAVGCADKQRTGRWDNNRIENSHLPFRRCERAMLRFRRMRSLHPDVRRRSLVRPQPLQPGPRPLPPGPFQDQPRRRSRRVAGASRRLRPARVGRTETGSH